MVKEIVVHYGFHPEIKRTYQGEPIQHVEEVRESRSGTILRLDNGAWIRKAGEECYETEWTGEERWARVEEVEFDEETAEETCRRELGYILAKVDREKGWL